jgi:predicted DNA-binding transcriptional regulator YafY
MARSFDTLYRQAAQSAGRKIAGILPMRLREEVATLREAISFIPGNSELASSLTETLSALRGALLDRRVIRFRYHARSHADTPETGEREVRPLGLAHVRGAWYLTAYDTARQDERTFRLARMENVRVLDAIFERPPGFRLRRLDLETTANITVRALFDASVTRWIIETPSFYAVAHEPEEDGLLVTLRVRTDEDVVQWLLSWGRHVRVLEPKSLRRRLAEEARTMAALYTDLDMS